MLSRTFYNPLIREGEPTSPELRRRYRCGDIPSDSSSLYTAPASRPAGATPCGTGSTRSGTTASKSSIPHPMKSGTDASGKNLGGKVNVTKPTTLESTVRLQTS